MLMLVFSREVRVLLETLFRPFAELALERAAAAELWLLVLLFEAAL